MADTLTLNYSWTKPEPGASSGTWGDKTNDNWDEVDADLKAVSNVADAALPKAGGTMTGQLVAAAGTFTAPSLTLTGDTTTGFYKFAAGEIGVSTSNYLTGKFTTLGWIGPSVGQHTGAVDGSTGTFSGTLGVTGLTSLNGGAVITPRATPTASDVGYLGRPTADVGATFTLALSQMGKSLRRAGGNFTATIPTNATVAFPTGTVIHGIGLGGTAGVIAATGVTLYVAGVAINTGACNQGGRWTLEKGDTDTWYLSGDLA